MRRTGTIALPESPPRGRLSRWLRRYGLAEVAGISCALLGAALVRALTGSDVATAYGGSLGETIGFYGVIVGREIWQDRRAGRPGLHTSLNLLIEFGIAELLDTIVIRPFAMAIGMRYLGPQWGVIAGKLAADIFFYLPVITVYEWRRKVEP